MWTRTLVLWLALLAIPALALADEPDWAAIAEVDTVVVETEDEDGSDRETTIWIVLVDGDAYIRTGDSSWGQNLVRDPKLELEVEGEDYDLAVEFVEDDALRERVVAAFNEKYGWSDTFIGWFRGDRPKIMRLVPRSD